jgi:hypothetical protein
MDMTRLRKLSGLCEQEQTVVEQKSPFIGKAGYANDGLAFQSLISDIETAHRNAR